MRKQVLYSKLHMAAVTDSEIAYDGSITIDKNLLKEAGIKEYEKVLVANVSNGNRFETYAISGGPGEIILNGATAHLGKKGDRVIIFSFCLLEREELDGHKPIKLFLDKENNIVKRSGS